jgi:hypothetical protein
MLARAQLCTFSIQQVVKQGKAPTIIKNLIVCSCILMCKERNTCVILGILIDSLLFHGLERRILWFYGRIRMLGSLGIMGME